MILNPQIAKEIHQAWIDDQNHPYRGRDERDYPNCNHLATVLDVAFRTSLLNEEGNPIRGSITLLSLDELERYEIPKRRDTPLVIRLNEPKPFDVDIVSKLTTVTKAGDSSLLVSCLDDSCSVWGIIYYNKSQTLFSELPICIPQCRHFPPDSPTIEIVGTGSLRVVRSGSVIGRIEKGIFKPSIPTPFTSQAMGKYMFRLFGVNVINGKFSTPKDGTKKGVLFACLEYLLSQIDNNGGGATILFVPDSYRNSAPAFAIFPWEISDGLELGSLINTRIAQDSAHTEIGSLKLDRTICERLDAIAQLATLDGAVLLTPFFSIIGFGVKLGAPKHSGQVREGADGFHLNDDIIDTSRLGTRHNSAINFVAAVPDSVGFVASEDGPIRGFVMSPDNEIKCWPDCRLSMFA